MENELTLIGLSAWFEGVEKNVPDLKLFIRQKMDEYLSNISKTGK